MGKIKELVRGRRSVRTFDGAEVSASDREKLASYIENIENPYGIPIEFRLLGAKEHKLTSAVVSGASLYVGAKVKRVPYFDEALGYSFEKLVLFAQSLGIGTVWLGGTMDRAAFERAMELEADERMPCVSPLGYPAKKMSLRETMMRKGVKADTREPFEKLFFDGAFNIPLSREKAGALAEPLEMVRLAPSAVNKQPWRVVAADDAVHFYLKRTKGFIGDAVGDMQKIDLGIALCHFALSAEENGLDISFFISDPGIAVEPDIEYISSYRIAG